MPELMTKKDAIEYLLYMKHDVQAKSPMDIALDTAIEALKQPTIEPKRGRWIQSDALDYKDPNGVIHVHGMCSCCRLIYDFRDMTSRFKFCPNCGARMDADEIAEIEDEPVRHRSGGKSPRPRKR